MITDTTLKNLNNFSPSNNNKRDPPKQQQCQKCSGLNKRIKLIRWIVYWVESIIKAMKTVRKVAEGNVVCHEVLSSWGQDYRC